MTRETLLHISASYYENMKSSVSQERTIGQILSAIQGDTYKNTIEYLREQKRLGNVEIANNIKISLPAVTFCATFDGRRRTDNCRKYNSLLVIDIDKLTSEEFERVGGCLKEDPYVATYWGSPSGTGWKGLVCLDYHNEKKHSDAEKHHYAFSVFERYLKEHYSIELDASGKDITRLCFMSWSPELYIKDIVEGFPVDLSKMVPLSEIKVPKVKIDDAEKQALDITHEPIIWNILDGTSSKKNSEVDRMTMEKIYKFLKRKNKSITSSYGSWVKVAFAIANTFHPVYGRRKFMQLCELDGASHDEIKSERLIYDAYCTNSQQCDMATIVYLAKREGYIC